MIDWTTILAVTAGVATASGAIAGLIKLLGEKKWEGPLIDVKDSIVKWKEEIHQKIADIQIQLGNVKSDVEDIKELKEKIKELDASIDKQATRLEAKIDDIMNALINFLGSKKHGD